MSLDQLQVPRGTALVRLKGPSVARNRNKIIEDHFLGDWACFIDDDQIVPANTLLNLLFNDRPIVGALYSSKRPPFYPMAFQKFDAATQLWVPYTWTALRNGPSVRLVAGAGTGGMLIRRDVFDHIPKPWFHWGEFSDDLYFCQKATAAGYPIYVDTQTPIGHTTTINIWPGVQRPGARLQLDWLNVEIADDSVGAAAPRVELTGAGGV